jgi:hypothetical protein
MQTAPDTFGGVEGSPGISPPPMNLPPAKNAFSFAGIISGGPGGPKKKPLLEGPTKIFKGMTGAQQPAKMELASGTKEAFTPDLEGKPAAPSGRGRVGEGSPRDFKTPDIPLAKNRLRAGKILMAAATAGIGAAISGAAGAAAGGAAKGAAAGAAKGAATTAPAASAVPTGASALATGALEGAATGGAIKSVGTIAKAAAVEGAPASMSSQMGALTKHLGGQAGDKIIASTSDQSALSAAVGRSTVQHSRGLSEFKPEGAPRGGTFQPQGVRYGASDATGVPGFFAKPTGAEQFRAGAKTFGREMGNQLAGRVGISQETLGAGSFAEGVKGFGKDLAGRALSRVGGSRNVIDRLADKDFGGALREAGSNLIQDRLSSLGDDRRQPGGLAPLLAEGAPRQRGFEGSAMRFRPGNTRFNRRRR